MCVKRALSFAPIHFLRVRQQTSDDAEKRQEGTYLKDILNAGFIGEPTEEGRAKSPQSKHQSEKYARYQSHLVRHQVGGINHDRRERRGNDESRQEGADNGPR